MLAIEPQGWFGLYAGCRGAGTVMVIDSSPARQASNERARFLKRCEYLGLQSRVRMGPEKFPDCSFDMSFDLILIHDSICSFDEQACPRLSRNLRAIKRYKQFLKQIFLAADTGATVIVTGYSRYNLFPFFHLSNPFAPGVDWDAQQSPALWSSLFTQVGFHTPRIRWACPVALGAVGKALFGNTVGAYFFTSRFCLTLSKSGSR